MSRGRLLILLGLLGCGGDDRAAEERSAPAPAPPTILDRVALIWPASAQPLTQPSPVFSWSTPWSRTAGDPHISMFAIIERCISARRFRRVS